MGNSDVESNLTLATDFIRLSAVFLLIKDAGLPVSMVALKNVLLTLSVICIHLVFAVADLMTAHSFLWPRLVLFDRRRYIQYGIFWFTIRGDEFAFFFGCNFRVIIYNPYVAP